MARILLTNPPDMLKNFYGDRALAGLRALGDVRINPLPRPLSTAELIDVARDCEVIVSHRGLLAAPALFASLPGLVAFVRCAVDIRTVDVAAASEHGVLVTQASAGFVPAVSEWVIAAMIDLGRHIAAAAEAYHGGQVPRALMGRQLNGSTLGLIGYGQIARHLADLAVALGMRVMVTAPHTRVITPALHQCRLPDLLAAADFVVCLAAGNAETESLMNAAAFAQMKPTAYFINAAVGSLVDEPALKDALDRGLIAGAALDVGRAPDQMPTPSLARHPKVIATPHVGGLTLPAVEHQALETVAQVAEILEGRAPKGAVNADRATRLTRFR